MSAPSCQRAVGSGASNSGRDACSTFSASGRRTPRARYVEVPVQIVYTEYSRSKGQSIINAVNIAFDMLLRKVAR